MGPQNPGGSRDDWDDDEAAVSINCCGQQHCDESPLLALDDDEGYNCKKQKEHQLDYTARRSKKKRKSGIAWLATMDLEYHDQNDDDDDPEPSPDNRFNDNNNAMSHLESSPLRNSGRLSRRRLSAASSVVSTVTGNGPMSEAEQEERRRKIQTIMLDSTLSQMEKSKSIQSLMDGRAAVEGGGTRINRRGSTSSFTSTCSASSYACSMAQAAALAADYYADDHSVTRQGYADNHTSDNPTPGMMDIATFTNLNLGGGGGDASDLNDAPTPSSPLIHASPSSRAEYYRRGDELSVASTVSSYNCDDDDQDEADGNICPRQQFAAAKSTTEASGPVGSYRQYHGRSRSLQDWTDTDRQISATQTTVLCNPVQVSRLMEQSRPACEHYKRNCTIISPCCALAFGCRICHDDCPILPPPVQNLRRLSATHVTPTAASAASVSGAIGGKVSGVPLLATGHKNKVERRRSMPVDLGGEDEEEHHLIDRFSIREVICRGCYIRQSSKTNNCLNCGIQFGDYHCNICNLWMSNEESPYHCADCGFCRVGGRENFTHCHNCGMCIDADLAEDHNCKSGKYMSDCPICQEDLFSSRLASHEMPCGHAIHWHCFKELTSYDVRCPVCKKTAESPDQMEATWSAIAMGIALQPVPSEMARMVNIYCSDCESSDCNLRWHFLGVRCLQCLSFNTTVERIVMQGVDAANYLDRLEATGSLSGDGGVPSNISMPAAIAAAMPMNQEDSESTDQMDEDFSDS